MYIKYCSICLEKINKCGRNITLTECNHTFHKKCLEQWLKENNNCPNCRVTLSIPKKCNYLNNLKCNNIKCNRINQLFESYLYNCNRINCKIDCNNICINISKLLGAFTIIIIMSGVFFLLILMSGIVILLLSYCFTNIKIKDTNISVVFCVGILHTMLWFLFIFICRNRNRNINRNNNICSI